MKSAPYLLILASVVTAGLALILFLYSTGDDETAPGASLTVEGQPESGDAGKSPETGGSSVARTAGDAGAAEDTANASGTAAPAGELTSEARGEIEIGINLARVRQDGTMVVAGQALADSTVNLIRDGKIIGTTMANEAGEWVIVPDMLLDPGSHLLSVDIIPPDGDRIVGPMAVVIDIPSGSEETPLVALVPFTDDTDAVARVLQAPDQQSDGGQTVVAGQTGVAGQVSSSAGAVSSGVTGQISSSAGAGSSGVAGQISSSAGAGSSGVAGQGNAASPSESGNTDDAAGPALMSPSVQIRTIQALTAKRLAVSGNSTGGITANLTVNDVSVAADLDDRGMFAAVADIDPDAESFRLRVELKGDGGEVLARASLRLSRAQIQQSLGNNSLLVVQRGDALWRIAYRTYGEGIRYIDIYRKNQKQIDDPDLIYPDQVFVIPNS
ncbi:LysM peptidoglycan-binding domain-containing protein [Alphaproteobacteria bacterium LSUCC0684]